MAKKYSVFLSSTYADLVGHRQAVQSAILQLGAEHVSMENFGARDARPADECIRLVKESDLFVAIVAHRYGFIPEGHGMSVTELEYHTAKEASIPRFIYIMGKGHLIEADTIEQGVGAQRLVAFKEALRNQHICQTFESPHELAAKVAADLGRHIAMQGTTRVGPGIPVEDVGIDSLRGPVVETTDTWNKRRNDIYERNRKLALAHVITPSSKRGQTFDVFIYLVRHKSEDFSDVRVAEFFLGPYWENKVFPAVQHNGFIGIATSAHGTFLCVCRVTFSDGKHVYLDRYIDFEMQRTGGLGS